MASPRVSVCIPTHNRPDDLREAIAGILSGTEQNFEIVVSDDADSQATRKVVEDFHDPRIRYLKCAVPRIEANWSNAIKNATAPYAFKLDDDDRIEAGFLKTCCDFLDAHPDVAIVFTGYQYFRGGEYEFDVIDRHNFKTGIVNGFVYGSNLLLGKIYFRNHKSAGVFRMRSAERIDYFNRATVDVIFTAAIAATGNVGYVAEPLFQYRYPDKPGEFGKGHEGISRRPLTMLLGSIRELFTLEVVRSQPQWAALEKSSGRMIEGAAIRYIASNFGSRNRSQGLAMVELVYQIEPPLKQSPSFQRSLKLIRLFSLFPPRCYMRLLDLYAESPRLQRFVSKLIGR